MSRLLLLVFMSLFSVFISARIVYFIGERYFFDRLFYQKSVQHGYFIPGKLLGYKNFGNRAKNMLALRKYVADRKQSRAHASILGASNNNEYTIVVLGDSYVWGAGIRTEQRFVVLLEKMLNRLRPTRVVDLGNPGDNFLQNYAKYLYASEWISKISLSVWGLVANDLLFNESYSNSLLPDFIHKFIDGCDGPSFSDAPPKRNPYDEIVNLSLASNTKNYCAYEKLLPFLPKEHAIYINLEDLRWQYGFMQSITIPLVDNGLFVFSPKPYYEKNYMRPNEGYITRNERLEVSKAEGHPNALANKIYAEALFYEITTNPRWGFIE